VTGPSTGGARALRIVAGGPTPAFEVADIAMATTPAEGQVRVAPLAVEVVPLDVQIARGAFPAPIAWPHQPCGSGIAVDVASGAMVAVYAGPFGRGIVGAGLAATLVDVPAAAVVAVPEGLDPRLAAAGLVNAVTARLALVDHGATAAGDTVLVLGATGGVGRAACQLAAALGAGRVVAASRAGVLVPGAHEAVVLADVAGRLPGAADVIVDCIGGAGINEAIGAGAARCRHVLVGYTAGPAPVVRLPLLLLREHRLLGLNAFAMAPDRIPITVGAALADLAAGTITAEVGVTSGLDVEGAAAVFSSVGGAARPLLLPSG